MAFKKRRDGIYLKKLPAFRRIFPYLMPTRTESLIYFTQKIDMSRLLDYLKELNADRSRAERITLFHVFLAAVTRVLHLRPELNRFVAGKRIYQHKDISLTFIVKKEYTEEADEVNARLVFSGTEDLTRIRDKVNKYLSVARSAVKGDDDKLVDFVAALPRPVINFIARLIKWLDYHNILPAFLMGAMPLYTSAYLANLGSIGLDAPFHHLFEYGSASLFLVIGKMHKEPLVDEKNRIVVRDCLNISVTLDERITEGFYCAKSIGLFKKIIENPGLLENVALTADDILSAAAESDEKKKAIRIKKERKPKKRSAGNIRSRPNK